MNDPETSDAEVTSNEDGTVVDWTTDGKDSGSVYQGPN